MVGGIREKEEDEDEEGKRRAAKSLDDASTASSWLVAIAATGRSGTTAAGFALC